MQLSIRSFALAFGLAMLSLGPMFVGMGAGIVLDGAGHGSDLPLLMLVGPNGAGVAVCCVAASLGSLPVRYWKISFGVTMLLVAVHAVMAFSVYESASAADLGYFRKTMSDWLARAAFGFAWTAFLSACAIGPIAITLRRRRTV